MEKQHALIKQFMTLVLHRLHPNFSEYPIEDMKKKEYSVGDAFENTEYEGIDHLLNAFYLNQIIEKWEKSKE